jgi:hypothetical protein
MHLVSDHSLNKQVLYNCKCDVLSKLIPWSRILGKLMLLNQAHYQVHNCQVHKGFPLVPILSQMTPIYTLSSYFLNICFNRFLLQMYIYKYPPIISNQSMSAYLKLDQVMLQVYICAFSHFFNLKLPK